MKLNRTYLAALSGACILLAGAASAADMTGPAADLPAFSWAGGYIGLHGGYGWGDYDLTSPSLVAGPKVDVDGFVGGVHAGYNFQFDSIVAGIEADFQNGPDGITPQGTVSPGWICNTGDCNVDINWYGTVRARLGYAFDRFLAYGTGGIAFADIDGGVKNSAQQGGGRETGWVAGLGLEYAFTDNMTLRGEYMHVDLGDLRFGTGSGTEPFLGKGAFDTVRLGISYKF